MPQGRRAYSPPIVEAEDIPLLKDSSVHEVLRT
jgi:hypothetical protein